MTSIKEQNTCIQASDSAHRVILCGDSHMKGFSKSIQSLLCSDFKLFSVVKPGSTTNTPSESMVETIKQLTHNDILVVSCGTNDYDQDGGY